MQGGEEGAAGGPPLPQSEGRARRCGGEPPPNSLPTQRPRQRGGPRRPHNGPAAAEPRGTPGAPPDTYNRAPLGHPLLHHMLHGDLRSAENGGAVSGGAGSACAPPARAGPAAPAASRATLPPAAPARAPRAHRQPVGDPAPRVHGAEAPAAQHGAHLVDFIKRLLLHFHCVNKREKPALVSAAALRPNNSSNNDNNVKR